MRVALAILVPLGAALLQAAIVPFLGLGDLRPNLALLVAASWAVAAGAAEASWWAFVGGLSLDLLSGGPLGAFAVAMLPAVAMVGAGERPIARPIPVLSGALLVTLAAAAAGALYVALLAVVGQPLPEAGRLAALTLGGAAVTGALALVVYPVARLIRRVTEGDSPF